MPQPDLALLRSRSYRTKGAEPDDVILVVEVSDTSLGFDRTTKLRLYARARVPEYWIADTGTGCLEVYRNPMGDGYRDRSLVPSSGTIAPLAFPDVVIRVADIFA
jgi:Uma2 family endonuclease